MKLQIGIVTYNRLPYLQKCIWSLIASTTVPYHLTVADDGSTDGSKEWIYAMMDRGLIHGLITANGVGAANLHNQLIADHNHPWHLMSADDRWFHRGWDVYGLEFLKYWDLGTLSIHDLSPKHLNPTTPPYIEQVERSGLGTAFIYRELWQKTGKFRFNKPTGRLGYFANSFVTMSGKVNIERNKHYKLLPHYCTNLDRKGNPLNESDYQIDVGYIGERIKSRKGVSTNYGLDEKKYQITIKKKK